MIHPPHDNTTVYAPLGIMRRNAPNMHCSPSILMDAARTAIDGARAVGIHGTADELDSVRARIATLALPLWRAERSNR